MEAIAPFLVPGLVLVWIVGAVWMSVVAVRISVPWFLAVLLIPGAVLVFVFLHWDVAKKPFPLYVGPALLVDVGRHRPKHVPHALAHGIFDPDHVGPERRKPLGGAGASQLAGEVADADVRERGGQWRLLAGREAPPYPAGRRAGKLQRGLRGG